MSRWEIVYDFADRWPNVHHMAFLFAFPLILFGIYYQQQRAPKNAAISWLRLNKWPQWLRTAVGLTIGGEVLSLLLIGTLLRDYYHLKTIYDQRQYLIVEGPVSHFDPMPKSGHKQESFRVNGVPFAFSDGDESTYSYHQAAVRGGVLKLGLQVRLGYVDHQGSNIILKLDTLTNKPFGVR